MKKILIFSLAYLPKYVGGAEIAIREITDRIDPNDFSFHLITLRFDRSLPRQERVGNVMVHRVGFGIRNVDTARSYRPLFATLKFFFIPLAVYRAWRLNHAHRFNGAWAMMSYMTLPLMFLRFAGVRIPYVLTLQEGDPFSHVFERARVVPLKRLLIAGFRNAVIIQAISTHLATWPRKLKVRTAVEVIPNGVDVERFSRSLLCEDRENGRKHLGIGEEEHCIMTVSRLAHKNAIDVVICAMAHLPPSAIFVVVGEGPERENLERLATKEKVSHRVRFVGEIDHHNVPRYLTLADVFVRVSRSEGMGISFIEAMAAGVPVIGTSEGGITDFLFDPDRNFDQEPTGLVAQTNDPEDTARQIARLLVDRELRDRCVKNALSLVSRLYNWDTIVREMRARVFGRVFEN